MSRDKKDGGARGGTWWGSPVKRATAAFSWVATGYVPVMYSSASRDFYYIAHFVQLPGTPIAQSTSILGYPTSSGHIDRADAGLMSKLLVNTEQSGRPGVLDSLGVGGFWGDRWSMVLYPDSNWLGWNCP